MTPQESVDSWQRLQSKLQSGVESIKGIPDKYVLSSANQPQLSGPKDLWIAENRRFQPHTTSSIVAWIRMGNFHDEPNDRIRFLLAARIEAAIWLSKCLLYSEGGQPSSLVPFPDTPQDDFCARLLIDWWDRAGQLVWFDQLCLQQRIAFDQSAN